MERYEYNLVRVCAELDSLGLWAFRPPCSDKLCSKRGRSTVDRLYIAGGQDTPESLGVTNTRLTLPF